MLMTDGYGRTIDYLRISVTDRCDLKCKYCMPREERCSLPGDIMTDEEILLAVEAAAMQGICKIKITGGEPLIRENIIALIQKIRKVPGIEAVTLTTNGLHLKERAEELKRIGIDGINISLDTMDPEKYEEITGADRHPQVLDGVFTAADLGLKVKINAVSLDMDGGTSKLLQQGVLPPDIRALIDLAKDRPIDVRFIELMPIGQGKHYRSVSHADFLRLFEEEFSGVQKDPARHGNGPAEYYRIDGYCGSIGLISAIHGRFCDCCNRIRLTADGKLKSCLCFTENADLLPVLRASERDDLKREKLGEMIRNVILEKPIQHCFERSDQITESKDMVSIGG